LPDDRRRAIEPLIAALKDDDPYMRTAAAIALGQMGSHAFLAVHPLRETLSDPANEISRDHYGRRSFWAWNLRHDRLHHRRSVAQAVRSALEQIESGDEAN
jgi:HEAT repeat protein